MQPSDDLDLAMPMQRLRARWPWLLLAALAGAALGWTFSWLRPPVYRANAALTIGIDYTLTDPLELVVEDRALDRVHQLILSDDTLLLALDDLQALDPANPAWADLAALRSRVSLEERLARWDLLAADRDPVTAARIANAWATAAVAQLQLAREHAWNVMDLGAGPLRVECFRILPQPTSQIRYWECVTSSPELEPGEQAELRAEVEASRGILPSLAFEWAEQAHPPPRPVVWDRGLLVLAGAVVGLIAGTWVALSLPVRGSRPRKDAAEAEKGNA